MVGKCSGKLCVCYNVLEEQSLTLVGNRHVSALESCVLTGGEEWSEDSSDVMWDLAHYITGDQKRLWAKVSGCCVL